MKLKLCFVLPLAFLPSCLLALKLSESGKHKHGRLSSAITEHASIELMGVPSAAREYLNFLITHGDDHEAKAQLQKIFAETPLRARLMASTNVSNFENLGKEDTPFVLALGDDALLEFVGKNLYEVCQLLGYDDQWMRLKLSAEKPSVFRLVVFEEEKDLDCVIATWQGVVDWISRHYPPQVAEKISLQMRYLDGPEKMDFKHIEEEALGNNRTMLDVLLDQRQGIRKGYDLEDASCDGSLYQVRQWLYDRGFRAEYRGDGYTSRGLKEYICSNRPIKMLTGMDFLDLGSLKPYSSQVMKPQAYSTQIQNPQSAALEYLTLLASGLSGEKQRGQLQRILARAPLRGRMQSHSDISLLSTLGRKDLPFTFVFGEDALSNFLGRNLYEICQQLGFDKDWMQVKLRSEKPWLFRLVVFQEEQDLDCVVATWKGAVDWISRHYPAYVAKKISSQIHSLEKTEFKEIEEGALGNQTMWNIFVDKSEGVKKGYDLEDESCEGSLYQVRQWLYDRGFREEYRGDGFTTGSLQEYICLNKPVADIASAAHANLGSLARFAGEICEKSPEAQPGADGPVEWEMLHGNGGSIPLIIDTDGGLDDYAALASLIMEDSRVQLLLVTTARGGCLNSAFTAELVRRFLNASGVRDVPVVQGVAEYGPNYKDQRWMPSHLNKLRVFSKMLGLYDEPIQMLPESCGLDSKAAIAIIEAAEKHVQSTGTKVVILSLAPLTNIAYAVEHFPERMKNAVSHIIMAADFVTKTTSEQKNDLPVNVRCDPASFWKVAKAKIPVYLCRAFPTKQEQGWNPLTQEFTLPELTIGAKLLNFLAFSEKRMDELEKTHEAICKSEHLPIEPKPKFGVEAKHLTQDSVVAFFLLQPKAFTWGEVSDLPLDVQHHVKRLAFFDDVQYQAWLQEKACREFAFPPKADQIKGSKREQ